MERLLHSCSHALTQEVNYELYEVGDYPHDTTELARSFKDMFGGLVDLTSLVPQMPSLLRTSIRRHWAWLATNREDARAHVMCEVVNAFRDRAMLLLAEKLLLGSLASVKQRLEQMGLNQMQVEAALIAFGVCSCTA